MPTETSDTDMGGLLTVGEAAKLLHVSVATLRRWESDGRVVAARTPTGHRRFRRTDIDALLSA
ncbi:hypothetical protein CH296_11035 [Rhodococcus sp. 14-2496-1d]|uniref:MerR family transcriptional regulator n=1 Tax=Rhodococcus sp. 14-2496-1d TaxID=2023146 RepID=UPI000B9C542E|nr:helix-turn-helix domain-containing protein [Rhodococcus sp. 14-2496-1d]OZF33163.1 hypothetical protein CH296_11035 [Rhodococcus sp. 14-2496-1d]